MHLDLSPNIAAADAKLYFLTLLLPIPQSHTKFYYMSKKTISSNSETDWQRLDAMTDAEIDLSDCPEITPEKFAKAVVRQGLPTAKNKVQVTLRIDSDVLEWYKLQGRGYQTQINSLLRAYKEAHH